VIELHPHPNGYDDRHYLYVSGAGDMGDGQTVKVNLGESVVCGRSRHCDWSLKKTPRYLANAAGYRDRLKQSLPFRATSRKHCKITYTGADMVEVENLSQNGTLVDGHKVDRIVLTDCRRNAHEIRLGADGVRLELRPGSLPIDGA
jgi:pSer/pThr/pTyr-binding forkhead associated (FHA) protein